jgi:hypothetical protein
MRQPLLAEEAGSSCKRKKKRVKKMGKRKRKWKRWKQIGPGFCMLPSQGHSCVGQGST